MWCTFCLSCFLVSLITSFTVLFCTPFSLMSLGFFSSAFNSYPLHQVIGHLSPDKITLLVTLQLSIQ